jgi:hypothetical protein
MGNPFLGGRWSFFRDPTYAWSSATLLKVVNVGERQQVREKEQKRHQITDTDLPGGWDGLWDRHGGEEQVRCFVSRKRSTAMKRERDDADGEGSSDDEMGPMPIPEGQTVKKKRKGWSTRSGARGSILTWRFLSVTA